MGKRGKKGQEPVLRSATKPGDKKNTEPDSDSDSDSDQLQATVKKIVSKSLTHVTSGSSGLGVSTQENIDVQALIQQLMPVIVGAVTAAVTEAVSRAMEKSVSMMEKRFENAQKQVLLLRFQHDEMEQYSRRESIRVFGVEGDTAEESEVDLIRKIISIAKSIDVIIQSNDISVAHRVGKSGGRARPVLVKFVSRQLIKQLMMNKKKLKTVSANTDAKVFITEDLTPLRYKLLMIAKHADAVDYAYTRDGRIICSIKGNKITIQSPDDLFKVGIDQPDLKALGLGSYVLGVE